MLKKRKIKPNREQNVQTKYCCWRANQHHQEPRKLRMPCPAKYPSQPITHKGNTQCKKMGSGEIGVLHSKPPALANVQQSPGRRGRAAPACTDTKLVAAEQQHGALREIMHAHSTHASLKLFIRL